MDKNIRKESKIVQLLKKYSSVLKQKTVKVKRKGISISISIRTQLLVGFLLPLIFVILVGTVSYKKAEQGMISNFETSVRTTIDTQTEYLDFGLSLIRMDAVQIKTDEELQNLMAGVYAKDLTKANTI